MAVFDLALDYDDLVDPAIAMPHGAEVVSYKDEHEEETEGILESRSKEIPRSLTTGLVLRILLIPPITTAMPILTMGLTLRS